MRRLIFFLTLLIIISGACNKDRPHPYWDTDMLLPLFADTVTIKDFINNVQIHENPDSSLKIVFNRELYDINGDSVVTIPDTVFYWEFSFFFPVTIHPGQEIINEHFDQILDFDFGIELEYAIMHSGEIRFEMENKSDGNIYSDFVINSAVSPEGDTFGLYNQLIPKHGLYSSVNDFTGYKMDFTGEAGDVYNTFNFDIRFWMDPDAPGPITLTEADTFRFYVHFTNVVLDYAIGNFGKTDFRFGPETSHFDMFNDINISGFSINDVNVMLRIDNYYGVDGIINLLDVSASNSSTGETVTLQGDMMDSALYISRAYQDSPGVDGIVPSENYFDFSNTNILDLLDIMPDEFTYFVGIRTNPSGDTIDHSHFFYLQTPIKVFMEAEINGGIAIEDLIINKSNTWNNNFDTTYIGDGNLKMKFTNSFPFSFDISVYLDDKEGNVIDTLIQNGFIDAAIPAEDMIVRKPLVSYINLPLNEKLRHSVTSAETARYVMTINSANNEAYKIYSFYNIEIQIIGDFVLHVKTD